ncbi:MAG: hypothetical protein ACYS9X_16975 [Planctomycetota bacterium]|jgi:hypothetical protein
MAPARRSGRGSRDSRRSAPAKRTSSRSNARSGSSRRSAREEDDPRSSGRRSARESARGGGPSKDTTVVVAGVIGAVVILGAGILLFSGGKKRIIRREERAPVPTSTSTRDWYSVGRREGADWASHTRRRGSMAGGDGDPFAKDKVLEMADMQTSNHYKKGLKGDATGQKRYIKGFCDGVRAVVGE